MTLPDRTADGLLSDARRLVTALERLTREAINKLSLGEKGNISARTGKSGAGKNGKP